MRLGHGAANGGFPGNSVRTSKYNIITFLPIFLLTMFSRVAYLYFAAQVRALAVPSYPMFCLHCPLLGGPLGFRAALIAHRVTIAKAPCALGDKHVISMP